MTETADAFAAACTLASAIEDARIFLKARSAKQR
jgi:hypothetical protein